MALIACPGCSLPRTAGDSAHPCPVCGYTPPPPAPVEDEDASALTLGPDIEPVTAPTPGPTARPPVSAPLHLAPSQSALHQLPPGPVSAQVYIATAPPTAKIRSPKAAPAPPSAPVPLVAAPPSVAVPAVAAAPPAPPSPAPWLLPWILAGIGFGGTLVCAAGWYLASTDSPALAEQPPTPAPVAAFREVAPTPRRVTPPPPVVPEAAPMPRSVADTSVPLPVRAGDFAILRIDQPNDIYKLDIIGAGNRLKLVGRAAKLSIDGVTGGAVIDATELVTKAVSLIGPIDGGSEVKVKVTDGGTVLIRGATDGSTVSVDAPGGTVTFEKWKGGTAAIDNARVTVTARSVTAPSPITGADTRVDVTLTARGHLRFVELSDAAKIVYRAARPDDPQPTVTPGAIKDTAECRRDD